MGEGACGRLRVVQIRLCSLLRWAVFDAVYQPALSCILVGTFVSRVVLVVLVNKADVRGSDPARNVLQRFMIRD